MIHSHGLRRPSRILSTLLAILIALQTFMAGCGSHGPADLDPDQSDDVDTTGTPVEIDRKEIGGEGLSVVSALDSVGVQEGSAAPGIEVSDETAQLLTAIDKNGEVRALAIGLPAGTAGGADSLAIGATSTALSILMLVPGITVADPDSAAERLDDLQALASFPTLDSILALHLATESLAEALAREEVKEAVAACVDEYLDLPEGKMHDGMAPSDFVHFDAKIDDPSSPAAVRVLLRQVAARYTNVYRRVVYADGRPFQTKPVLVGYDAFPGVNPTDLLWKPGGIVPTEHIDVVDLHCGTDIAEIQYWATGVGWGSGGLNPNADYGLSSDFTRHSNEAALQSAMVYFVKPLLTILVGAFVGNDLIKQLILITQGTEVNVRIATATSAGELIAALSDLLGLQVEYLLAFFALPLLGLIWTFTQIYLAELQILGSIIFWSATPKISVFSVPNPISQTDCLPIVVSTTPAKDATGVDVSTLVAATFSTDMDPATIAGASFTLDNGVTGDVSYDAASRTTTFTPYADLDPGVRYTATIASDVADLDGLTMEKDYSWSFMTSTGNEVWTVSYDITGRSCSSSCETSSSCNCWDCIDCESAWLLTAGDGRRFIDIEVDADEDAGTLFHESGGWGVGADFGTFRIENASLRLEGTFTGDTYDFDLTFWGTAYDRFYCEYFESAGPFSVTYHVTGGVRSGDTITGSFTGFTAVATPPGNCSTISIDETVGGTVSVDIGERLPGPAPPAVSLISR